jgi:DNA-binding NarL/FixJ family response regulator
VANGGRVGRPFEIARERLDVVVAHHSAATRAAYRAAVEADSWRVVAEAADAARAVAAVREHRPRVCLLDAHLPGSGAAATAEIARTLSSTAVVVVTASRHEADLRAALAAGASGYLLDDGRPERLGPALRGVVAGEAVLPHWLVARMVARSGAPAGADGRLGSRSHPVWGELTDREREVLDLMAAGLSTDAMAARLFVAPVTVRTHIRAVLRKLNAPDRATAVRVSRGGSSASA